MAEVHKVISGRVLHGTGRRPLGDWTGFAAGFPGATAVWADLEGMHRAGLPKALPQAATHLWFWTADYQGRVRLDGAFWVAGVLAAEEATLPAPCRPVRSRLVVDATLHRPCEDTWGPTRQRRGDPAAWQPLAQLVPRSALTAVFLSAPGHVGLRAGT
ncbi:MAG: hypothetical protein ACT4NY_13555 [Pseudonocardiales bacterium]